jgi:hypothetical protein
VREGEGTQAAVCLNATDVPQLLWTVPCRNYIGRHPSGTSNPQQREGRVCWRQLRQSCRRREG